MGRIVNRYEGPLPEGEDWRRDDDGRIQRLVTRKIITTGPGGRLFDLLEEEMLAFGRSYADCRAEIAMTAVVLTGWQQVTDVEVRSLVDRDRARVAASLQRRLDRARKEVKVLEWQQQQLGHGTVTE